MVNKIVDKNDPKYVLALQFLNHILTNNNKPQIQDILEFKDITRITLYQIILVKILLRSFGISNCYLSVEHFNFIVGNNNFTNIT